MPDEEQLRVEKEAARREMLDIRGQYVVVDTYRPGEDIRRPEKVLTVEALERRSAGTRTW